MAAQPLDIHPTPRNAGQQLETLDLLKAWYWSGQRRSSLVHKMCGKGCGYCCGCCDPRIKTCWSPCFWHSTVRYRPLFASKNLEWKPDYKSTLYDDLIWFGYNLTSLSTGQEAMLWLVIPWGWHSASSPTLLISCRFHTIWYRPVKCITHDCNGPVPSSVLEDPPVLTIFTGRWFEPVLPASLRDGDPSSRPLLRSK